MELKYKEYLQEGTKKIIEIVSSPDVGEDEKRAIVEAFANELSNNVGNTERLHDYEPLIYGVSIRLVDEKITSVLSSQDASDRDFENAMKLCRRQRELFEIFNDKKWKLPKLENSNIDKCEETLRKRQESTSISSKITEKDRQIDDLIRSAQADLSIKSCDTLVELVSELEKDIAYCKSKKFSVPPINNKDTKRVRKRISDLRKVAEQKEALHQSIYDVDLRIHGMVSLQGSTPEQWQEVVGLCQKQTGQLSECTKNKWPMPLVRYGNPDEVADKYKHYIEMISIDRQLLSERESLSSNKQYKTFLANCRKQKSNVEICNRNGWELPVLSFSDPNELLNVVHKEKSERDRSKRIKDGFIKVGIFGVCILALIIFGIHMYRDGKVRIPFDSSYVSGKLLSDVYSELEDAGFENITQRPDTSGWLESGQVISVSIDNSNRYRKNSYKKSDVTVAITYSCKGRKYVTDLLTDWKKTKYIGVQETLKKSGFTNITVEEVVTSDKDKDRFTAAISLNGKDYTNEVCYLSPNAPIVISYYVFKIGIGNDNSQFIGQDYETIVDSLKESGFTNVQTQRISTGWAKGNSIVGVTVDNVDTYNSSESFDPDVKIVVKYSSDDRGDITSTLENWQTTDYTELQSALRAKGYTNITIVNKETSDISKNGLVASITLNNDDFTAGDCFLQTTAPIKIEYYVLTIVIGNTASGFEGSQYADIVNQLKTKGFTNIQLLRANNLINGWIRKEGSIKSFMIEGGSDFADTDSFYYDARIVIVVNTFKNKGCEDITDVEY